jgi:hypothetical protein
LHIMMGKRVDIMMGKKRVDIMMGKKRLDTVMGKEGQRNVGPARNGETVFIVVSDKLVDIMMGKLVRDTVSGESSDSKKGVLQYFMMGSAADDVTGKVTDNVTGSVADLVAGQTMDLMTDKRDQRRRRQSWKPSLKQRWRKGSRTTVTTVTVSPSSGLTAMARKRRGKKKSSMMMSCGPMLVGSLLDDLGSPARRKRGD